MSPLSYPYRVLLTLTPEQKLPKKLHSPTYISKTQYTFLLTDEETKVALLEAGLQFEPYSPRS